MADRYQQDSHSVDELQFSPRTKDFLLRLLDTPESSGLPVLPSLRPQQQSPINFHAKNPDTSLTPFALLTDPAVRYQLPRVGPLDLGPGDSVQTDQERFSEDQDSDLWSTTVGDSSTLLSELLEHLEEEAAQSPKFDTQPTWSPIPSGPSIHYSIPEESDSFVGDLSAIPRTPDRLTPPLDVKTPGHTLGQSYKQFLEEHPLDQTCDSDIPDLLNHNDPAVHLRHSSTSWKGEGGNDQTAIRNPRPTPTTPRRVNHQVPSSSSFISPTFFGPLPTPFAHREFLATTPSRSLSTFSPTSPSPTPQSRRLLQKGLTRQSRFHLGKIFGHRRTSSRL
ncbi:hypothetical protein N7462_007470 [Penicillium macrosclerotiorum]|uniref:uncharacterized protein n=1 Tax=Penicillium macrosclerotiorum TaxID=303699 RepID=UPI002547D6B1|nr:uncharacterized protein N7462_007470 [Penicillium macrosclerotiorum]KAJ5679226.1 hypothetical protein N7462_007470 [Penicillium macrosclerotiorum]